jgi:hypothetical protein
MVSMLSSLDIVLPITATRVPVSMGRIARIVATTPLEVNEMTSHLD